MTRWSGGGPSEEWGKNDENEALTLGAAPNSRLVGEFNYEATTLEHFAAVHLTQFNMTTQQLPYLTYSHRPLSNVTRYGIFKKLGKIQKFSRNSLQIANT